MKEPLKVLLPNGAVFGVVTFTQVEMTLKITLLALSCAYAVLHCALLWRKPRAKRIADVIVQRPKLSDPRHSPTA